MDWFLYDNGLRHEIVNCFLKIAPSDVRQGLSQGVIDMYCDGNYVSEFN